MAVFAASDVPPDSGVNRLKNRVLSARGPQGLSSILPGTVKYLPAARPCAWFFMKCPHLLYQFQCESSVDFRFQRG